MDFADVLQATSAFLRAEGISYALIGGHALAAYGLPRPTFDVDIAVDAAAQDAVIEYLEGRGYETVHRSAGYSNHNHADADRGRVDVVYLHGRTAERFFSAARDLTGPGGLTMPVAAPEHLIAMKLHAIHNDASRKPQDLADIARLVEAQELAWESLRSSFEKYGMGEDFDALSKST